MSYLDNSHFFSLQSSIKNFQGFYIQNCNFLRSMEVYNDDNS